MTALTGTEFPAFFETVHGVAPFPWQTRLATRVADAAPDERAWPDVLALPTASGKTSCIDIAVFALACQTDRAAGARTAARRIFFVVDRRIIVDEAYDHARRLAERLRTARDGMARRVADALRRLAGGDLPLACASLRGGVYRDEAWARSLAQPTFVASTVDQIGSRLFYRGYGLSPRTAAIQAGLIANDALVVLDEAHCANPFRQTLESVRHYRRWADQPVALPFDVVITTATPRDVEGEVFRPSRTDLRHPVLGKRLSAKKPTRLLEVVAKSTDAFAEALAEQARHLITLDRRAIGIIVNRVATARAVQRVLQRDDADVVLLMGRMRPLDRDETVREWLSHVSLGRDGSPRLTRPLFVVATQCLEVGANLDFDGLVTECASLDALRQRFGRANRAGRAIETQSVILMQNSHSTSPDPIYGNSLVATWTWLRKGHRDTTDMGVAALDARLDDESTERLTTFLAPAPDAPVLLPAYLDAWVQTTPTPAPDPNVAIFLHGPDRGAPDVKVCWRADLNLERPDTWLDTLMLCPPAAGECMPVPLAFAQRWLRGAVFADLSGDVEGGDASDDNAPEEKLGQPHGLRMVARWFGSQDSHVTNDAALLRPGDTLVIPEALGDWELFGHIPPDVVANGVDRAEEANLIARNHAVLRVTSRVPWLDRPAAAALRLFAAVSEIPEDIGGLRMALHDVSTASGAPGWLKVIASALGLDPNIDVSLHPDGGLVLQGSRRLLRDVNGEWLTAEEERSSRGAPVELTVHLMHVERELARMLETTGLSPDIVEDLRLAARFHDVGKADGRFQALLYGGNRAAACAGPPLAKSPRLPGSWARQQEARRRSGYPQGGRHELVSVRLVESQPKVVTAAHDLDLVLYLIAAHHGYCRPYAPVIDDLRPERVSFVLDGDRMEVATTATEMERLDSGVVERFWRLVRRYGWWGLAFYEAAVRLADHRASAAEEGWSNA
jgi:CRISPR-associated endonuclease/helicase Cas3